MARVDRFGGLLRESESTRAATDWAHLAEPRTGWPVKDGALSLHAPQLEVLAARVSATLTETKRFCEAEAKAAERRSQQLERRVKEVISRAEIDRRGGADDRWRERLAELQGTMLGLSEETQSLGKRLDSLDERVFAKTGAAEEMMRQSLRDIERRLQSQAKVSTVAVEEERRQAGRQRRMEQLLQELSWRYEGRGTDPEGYQSEMEEHPDPRRHLWQEQTLPPLPSGERDGEVDVNLRDSLGTMLDITEALSARISQLEAWRGEVAPLLEPSASLLEGTLDPLHAAGRPLSPMPEGDEIDADSSLYLGDLNARVASLAGRLSDQETKATSRFEELTAGLAALKIKVDNQQQRQTVLCDRLEVAHPPTLEVVQTQLAAQERELRYLEAEAEQVKLKLQADSTSMLADSLASLSDQVATFGHRTEAAEALLADFRHQVHALGSSLRDIRSMGRPAHLESTPEMPEQLMALADQLEVVDELVVRICKLEEHTGLSKPDGAGPSPSGSPKRGPPLLAPITKETLQTESSFRITELQLSSPTPLNAPKEMIRAERSHAAPSTASSTALKPQGTSSIDVAEADGRLVAFPERSLAGSSSGQPHSAKANTRAPTERVSPASQSSLDLKEKVTGAQLLLAAASQPPKGPTSLLSALSGPKTEEPSDEEEGEEEMEEELEQQALEGSGQEGRLEAVKEEEGSERSEQPSEVAPGLPSTSLAPRRMSTESSMSHDVSMSEDENVSSSLILAQRCVHFEDILRPGHQPVLPQDEALPAEPGGSSAVPSEVEEELAVEELSFQHSSASDRGGWSD